MDSFVGAAPDRGGLVWIPGADHFFAGTADSPGSKLDLFAAELRAWLGTTFNLPR